jgi:protein required for attachment to host cells
MDENFIVVANASRARFFAQPRDGAPLEEGEGLLNAAARMKSRDTESDVLGRQAGSRSGQGPTGAGQHSGYSPHQTPFAHHLELFAREVATAISRRFSRGGFRHLVLVASPEFLGMLRKMLDDHLASLVRLQFDKDYTHVDVHELREFLTAQRVRG